MEFGQVKLRHGVLRHQGWGGSIGNAWGAQVLLMYSLGEPAGRYFGPGPVHERLFIRRLPFWCTNTLYLLCRLAIMAPFAVVSSIRRISPNGRRFRGRTYEKRRNP
ncbi:protein of unknown function [Pseudomonas inefficax]|uniref:Uncharacterized protein n=1 Tax=Pseudomonas inefficax TaxID=2078786 RepID=A0AAQ1PBP1_9PSED|nr:protein of unknown function [Pseudomonas inefficax]